jgi:deoxyribodipyrimidine photo-lyase
MAPNKLVWFRNDLRTEDNHALYHACQNSAEAGVIAVVTITPKQWKMQDEAKCRVQFWLANLEKLKEDLAALNIPLKVIRAATNRELPEQLWALARQLNVSDLYFNQEYPEYEQARDQQVQQLLLQKGVACHVSDSDLILPPGSVLNQQGLAYKVFTPFSKAWRQLYLQQPSAPLPSPVNLPEQNYRVIDSDSIPADIGYGNQVGASWNSNLWPAGADHAHQLLQQFVHERSHNYKQLRDFPVQAATSSLSPYLSTGVLTTRQCIAAMQAYSEDPDWFYSQWITELIWREFYRHLLVAFPQMNRWQPFKPEIETKISWQHDEKLFRAWSEGETGFAIVDAGMKQLLETGWMHNRVRMISASFLTKLLRQDWRLGARFFMQHLIDGDFASNLGGWQWSASVGADAAPYFRIFSPMRQTERFDPKGAYISRWLPDELKSNRPAPVIDYAIERNRSIDEYKNSGVLDERR